MEEYVIDFNSVVWEQPAPGIRYKAVRRAGRRLRLVEFSQNFVDADWCLNGHFGYVLEGDLKINFNGKYEHLKSGDGVAIPAGEKSKHKTHLEPLL